MNKFKLAVIAFAGLVAVATAAPLQTAAISPANEIKQGVNAAGGGGGANNNFNQRIKDIINVMLFLIGAISVIMIIIGGIRYTTSAGDSSRVKASKDTIMYAVVGLVIALMAFAIVNFVVGAF
ncbi:MAG TPA: hypothetical protein VFM68_00955 [Candidatus Saccharimonadales bacterium]|nr:hypothetical protein [Candidatus Saccharimonadales bacterium]